MNSKKRSYNLMRIIFTKPELAVAVARARARRGQVVLLVLRESDTKTTSVKYGLGIYVMSTLSSDENDRFEYIRSVVFEEDFDTLVFGWGVAEPDERGTVSQAWDDDQATIADLVLSAALQDQIRSIWRLDQIDSQANSS